MFHVDIPTRFRISCSLVHLSIADSRALAVTAQVVQWPPCFRVCLSNKMGPASDIPSERPSLLKSPPKREAADLFSHKFCVFIQRSFRQLFSGIGLMEIVTEPDFRTGAEAAGFVRELQQILRVLGTCEGSMEGLSQHFYGKRLVCWEFCCGAMKQLQKLSFRGSVESRCQCFSPSAGRSAGDESRSEEHRESSSRSTGDRFAPKMFLAVVPADV